MVDLALQEDLTTRFRIVMTNDDDDQIGELLGNPRFLLGLSDAGAHTSQLCDAGNSTTLLSYWVRERRALTLEQAVWRMTGHPAEVYGLTGRGRIAPGWVSDLVAFDPDTVGCQRDRADPGLSGRSRPAGDTERGDTPCLGERHSHLVRRGAGSRGAARVAPPSGREPTRVRAADALSNDGVHGPIGRPDEGRSNDPGLNCSTGNGMVANGSSTREPSCTQTRSAIRHSSPRFS